MEGLSTQELRVLIAALAYDLWEQARSASPTGDIVKFAQDCSARFDNYAIELRKAYKREPAIAHR